jgi:hypothetical protein
MLNEKAIHTLVYRGEHGIQRMGEEPRYGVLTSD